MREARSSRGRTILLLAVLVLSVAASAQQQDQLDAAAGLRWEALRLSVMSALPEEARAQAEELLQGWMELQAAGQEQETAWLRAYVSALESGEPVAVAAALAGSQVADSNLELARQQQAFRDELTSFVVDNPEAVIALAMLAHDIHASGFAGSSFMGGGGGFHGGMMFGPGSGRRMGGFGGGGLFGPGAGPGGMGPWMHPGMMEDGFDGIRMRDRLFRPDAPDEESEEPEGEEN